MPCVFCDSDDDEQSALWSLCCFPFGKIYDKSGDFFKIGTLAVL